MRTVAASRWEVLTELQKDGTLCMFSSMDAARKFNDELVI